MKKLGTRSDVGTGFFAAKPVFWERPAFVIWTAAQPDPAKAEADLAAADPTFAQVKEKYDKSRRTVTRTGAYTVPAWESVNPLHQFFVKLTSTQCATADYEVDFITYFTRLTGSQLGATFDPDYYVTDTLVDIPKL